MKISFLALAGLTSLAFADKKLSLMQRQAQTIVDVINSVNTATQSLDTAIKAYNGGDPSALLSASQAVLTATNNGVQTVNGATSLSTTDALTLQQPVTTLEGTLNTTINDLISKKSQLVAAGAGGTTEQALMQQQTAAQSLISAITSKVPTAVQSVASQLSQPIISAIQMGVTAFQGTGTASSSASGSGSGGTATTSAAKASGSTITMGTTAGVATSARTTSAKTTSAATFTGAADAVRPAIGALAMGAAIFAL